LRSAGSFPASGSAARCGSNIRPSRSSSTNADRERRFPVSILKRGKNYQIDYYCKGKRYRELIGPSKKEAEAVLGKRLNEIREGKFFGKVKLREILMEDLVRDYLERFQGKKVVDEKRYMQIILESFGGKFVSDIDRREVESFQAVRRATLRKDGLPRANSTCNREVEALRRLLNKAIEWGMLERNPASRLKSLPEPQGRTRFLSLDEAKRLLEASSRHLRPIIVCALETGMRRGEILNLRWSDVDMKTHTIYLGKTKNGESRHIPISNRLISVLSGLPRRLGSDHVFAGEPKIGKTGNPFHDVRTSFENACRRAGIEGFRFHDLRHTAASHLAMAGVPLRTVGEILGHKTAAMTERYAHLTPEHTRKAVESLPDWEAGEKDSHKIVTK
jgi:integrase